MFSIANKTSSTYGDNDLGKFNCIGNDKLNVLFWSTKAINI